jgi:hypothetical protein
MEIRSLRMPFVRDLKWWIILLAGIAVTILLMPSSNGSLIDEKIDRVQAESAARKFLENSGYDLQDYHSSTTRSVDNTLLSYFSSHLPKDSLTRVIAGDSIPFSNWQVRFYLNIPKSQPQTSYRVWLSSSGKIHGVERVLPDSSAGAEITKDEAMQLATSFIAANTEIKLAKFKLVRFNVERREHRTDYYFFWEKPSGLVRGNFTVDAVVQGDVVGTVRHRFELPEKMRETLRTQETRSTFIALLQFLVIVALTLVALVMFLRKYHAGEIWVRMGLVLFSLYFFTGLFYAINQFPTTGESVSVGNLGFAQVQVIVFAYNILIKNLFVAILLLTSWAVGESNARSLWPGKLSSIDSLLNRRFFTLDGGRALLRGGAIGTVLVTFYLGILSLFTGYGAGLSQVELPFNDSFKDYLPFLSIVLGAVMAAVISEVVFRFFLINITYNRWRSKTFSTAISALLWTGGYLLFGDFPLIDSTWINLMLALGTGIIFAWLYFRYDLMTVIAAHTVAAILFQSFPLMTSSADWHRISLLLLSVSFLIPAAVVFISYIRQEKFSMENFGIPAHIRRISERERMQKELEIARNVQMGLLPKENPKLEKFDISGICIPAREVGGDYFDYVQLSPTRLGIAIGDVSGKGVPAAIYMTLTKGILQSHAGDRVSPREVLSKVNRLLYKTIEKNSFVSIFYAVLDLETRQLTYARAGHNPGIAVSQHDGSSKLLTTEGIALGLEAGTVFDKTLREHTLQLTPGDVIVYYTDGITEAMNERYMEYGEDKFIATISRNRHLESGKMIAAILEDVHRFTAGTPQHDDMTIVALKVL